MKFFYYFNLKAHARLIFRTHLKNPIFEMGSIKKAVDNKTIVLYKRLILTADKNPWMIAKS